MEKTLDDSLRIIDDLGLTTGRSQNGNVQVLEATASSYEKTAVSVSDWPDFPEMPSSVARTCTVNYALFFLDQSLTKRFQTRLCVRSLSSAAAISVTSALTAERLSSSWR
jgi:hypothetical protein